MATAAAQRELRPVDSARPPAKVALIIIGGDPNLRARRLAMNHQRQVAGGLWQNGFMCTILLAPLVFALATLTVPPPDKIPATGGDITLSLPPFPMRAIALQGSYTGSLTEIAELIELVKRTGLPPVPVATRPLADVNAVLSELRAGKVIGRVVLMPA